MGFNGGSGSSFVKLLVGGVTGLATRTKTSFQVAISGAHLITCVTSWIADRADTSFERILERNNKISSKRP